MTERYDVLSGRQDKSGKTHWTKVGSMWPSKSGEGFGIVLDCIPGSVDGQFRLQAFVPKPKDDSARPSRTDLDDEIPF